MKQDRELPLVTASIPFLLLLFPLLVFHPAWIQAERAHRGLAMLGIGLSLALLQIKAQALRFPRSLSGPLALWVVLAFVSSLWATDPWLSIETSLWYFSLLCLLPIGCFLRNQCPSLVNKNILLGVLLVGLYGIAQSFGLSWPYVGAKEVLGTLANRNASAEWMTLAFLTLLALRPRSALIAAPVALFFLLRNGSRGPAIALSVCGLTVFIAWKSLFPSLHPKFRPLALSLCLPFLLLLLPLSFSKRASGPKLHQKQDTLSIRKEILASTLRMTKAHLPLGIGAGNFPVLYPEYRSQKEIQLSTFGHQFQTRALSAHNDLAQLLAELGILAFIPLTWFLLALWKTLIRQQPSSSHSPPSTLALLPLTGFVLLSLSRSPLQNAPAAILPFLALSLLTKGDTHVWPRQNSRIYAGLRAIGSLSLILMGMSIVFGHSFGAAFVRAQKAGLGQEAYTAIDRARRIDPFATDWALLEAQMLKTREPARATALLDLVLHRRPGSYRALIERAKMGLRDPLFQTGGRQASQTLLRLDPSHPMALLLASEYRFLDGKLSQGLSLLERLADPVAIDKKRTQILALAKRAPLAQKIPLMRLAVELRRLGRKLFPADSRFAGSRGPKKEKQK